MNLQNFIQKYTKQRIDIDNQFGYQCWDLSQKYVNEVWEIDYWLSCRTTGGVKDIYNDFDRVFEKDKFIRYPNLRDTVPNIGDLVVWGFGQYGHIAIVVEATVSKLTVFEQNAGQGDGDGLNGDECKITEYSDWSGILGFITPKLENQKPKLSQIDSIIVPQNPNEPTPETWQKLETTCSLEHFKFVKDAVQNSDWNWFLSSYADRYLEKKNLEIKNKEINEQLTKVQNEKIAELEKTKNEFDFSTAFKNTSQNLESLKSEQILKIEPKLFEKENFKINKDAVFGFIKNHLPEITTILSIFGYNSTQDQVLQAVSIAAPFIASFISFSMEKIYKLNLKK